MILAITGTRCGLIVLAGALSRESLRRLIRRLKPAASPALMERGAARSRRENRPLGDGRAFGANGWNELLRVVLP